MVTSSHEAAHRILLNHPTLLSPVFELLGVALPEKAEIEVLTVDVTEIKPLERRVDSVLRIAPPDGSGFLLAIEAQSRRAVEKEMSWAYYVAYLQAKYRLPTLLLVICHDPQTATWACGPFRMGTPDWTSMAVYPLVLGPDNVPMITDPQVASRDLAMATLSAMTHGRDDKVQAILKALARALGSVDQASLSFYSEMLEIGLGDTPAREFWRQLMSVGSYFPGRGTLVEETFLEGEAKAKAEWVVRLLETRGIAVPAEVRERITACADLEELTRWFDRAVTVSEANDIFLDSGGN